MYNNISLYFSSECNMKCAYCDINKNVQGFFDYNRNVIRKDIESGAYAKNVIEKCEPFKDKVCLIGLWGCEPLINSDLFDKLIEPLLNEFQAVEEVNFSTNSWLGYEHSSKFIYFINDYNSRHPERTPIKFGLQISLDGPPYINDVNRRKGTTERTIQHVKDLADKLPSDLITPVKIHSKCTTPVENMIILNEDKQKMYEFFKFFEDIQDYAVNHSKCNNAHFIMTGMPTLVNPGKHTQQDGRILAEFIRNLRNFNTDVFEHTKQPLFTQLLRVLQPAILGKSFKQVSRVSLCSSGRTTANLNSKGELFGCMGLYSSCFLENSEVDNFAHTTLKDNSNDNCARMRYIDLAYHNFDNSRRNFFNIIVKQLAAAGQIEKEYLHNEELVTLMYRAWGGLTCHYGCLAETHNIWIPMTSQIKFIGNGAVQESVKYIHQLEGGFNV